MKLRLAQADNITVLDILEEVSLQNIPVLKAGVTKLMQSGKNQIILNVLDAKKLDAHCMQEMLKFHEIGTKSGGQIIIVGQFEIVREAYKLFQEPPPTKCYPTLDAGLSALKGSDSSASDKKVIAPGLSTDQVEKLGKEELKAEIAKYEALNAKKKEKLGKIDFKEIRKLRFENTYFKRQLESYEAHITYLNKQKKKPFDEDEDLLKKVQELETAFETFLKQAELLGK